MKDIKTYEGFFDWVKDKRHNYLAKKTIKFNDEKRLNDYCNKIENFLNTEDAESIRQVFLDEGIDRQMKFYISLLINNGDIGTQRKYLELPQQFGNTLSRYSDYFNVSYYSDYFGYSTDKKCPKIDSEYYYNLQQTTEPDATTSISYSGGLFSRAQIDIIDFLKFYKIESGVQFTIVVFLKLERHKFENPSRKDWKDKIDEICSILQSVLDLGHYEIVTTWPSTSGKISIDFNF